MPSKYQRSISIRGEVYDPLLSYCRAHHVSVPKLIEKLTADIPHPNKATNAVHPEASP